MDSARYRRTRHIHPMMLEELMHMSGDPGDPVAILVAASLVRDDLPWLYELAMEAYRAAKSGDPDAIERERNRLKHFSEFLMRGPMMEELGIGGRESHMFAMELPRMLERALARALESRRPRKRPRPTVPHDGHE